MCKRVLPAKSWKGQEAGTRSWVRVSVVGVLIINEFVSVLVLLLGNAIRMRQVNFH